MHACQYHRSGGSTRPALDRKRGAHRALRIVLLCDRVAEQRHEPVAELLGDLAPHFRDRGKGGVEISVAASLNALPIRNARLSRNLPLPKAPAALPRSLLCTAPQRA